MRTADRLLVGEQVVQRVVEGLGVVERRLVADALVRLRLRTNEQTSALEGHVGSEVGAVIEALREVEGCEHRPENAIAQRLVDLVGDVAQRVVALRVRRGLEDEVPRTVVGNAEGRVLHGLRVEPVASTQILHAADEQRRAAGAEACLGLRLEVHAHRLAIVVLAEEHAGLLQQVAAHGKLRAVVAARDRQLVADLVPFPGDQILPVGDVSALERGNLL